MEILHQEEIPEGWEAVKMYLKVCSGSPQRLSQVMTAMGLTSQERDGVCGFCASSSFSCKGTEASRALPSLSSRHAGREQRNDCLKFLPDFIDVLWQL